MHMHTSMQHLDWSYRADQTRARNARCSDLTGSQPPVSCWRVWRAAGVARGPLTSTVTSAPMRSPVSLNRLPAACLLICCAPSVARLLLLPKSVTRMTHCALALTATAVVTGTDILEVPRPCSSVVRHAHPLRHCSCAEPICLSYDDKYSTWTIGVAIPLL